VHTAISKRVFGINEAVCEEVNRLVDEEDVHDLGRRVPEGPRPFEEFLYPDVASERLMRVKRAWKALLSMTSKSVERAYAFYLHHALDLLAPRLIAIRATGLPLERVADNIRKAVCGELSAIGNKLGGLPKLGDFLGTSSRGSLKWSATRTSPCGPTGPTRGGWSSRGPWASRTTWPSASARPFKGEGLRSRTRKQCFSSLAGRATRKSPL
jgi:hypothetical protein